MRRDKSLQLSAFYHINLTCKVQSQVIFFFFFFFNDTATTEIYTLSLHDALPIFQWRPNRRPAACNGRPRAPSKRRSEEHTSELQSQSNLVCRLLLEKKNS